MRIVDIRETAIPLNSTLANSSIDFSEMTTSVVTVITDVKRDGKPVVGTFTFTDTGNPITTGVAAANVALGQFNTAAFVGPAAYTLLRSWAFESYVQDTWKATPHLTFEYGVRYAYYQPWWAKWNDISNFYPQYYNKANAAVVDPGLGYIVSGSPYNGIVLPGSGYPSSAAGRAIGARDFGE